MVESEWRKPGERAKNPERGYFVALRRERTAGLLAGLGLKGKVSTACYAAGIGMAFVAPIISLALYVGVAFFLAVARPPDRARAQARATGVELGDRSAGLRGRQPITIELPHQDSCRRS